MVTTKSSSFSLVSVLCIYSFIALAAIFSHGIWIPEAMAQSQGNRQVVNGFNAAQVQYQGGTFQQLPDGSWTEQNRNGRYSFRETGRDEWSVYLLKADGSQLQLDLWRGKILYNGSDLYNITDVSAQRVQARPPQARPPQARPDQQINGYNVAQVEYQGGMFQQLPDGSWTEQNRNGRYSFRETGRDDWSVYLLKADGSQLQLDLWRGKILYNGSDLYNITDASAQRAQARPPQSKPPQSKPSQARPPQTRPPQPRPDQQINGTNVRQVEYPGGTFWQLPDGSWAESNRNGRYSFRETGRDEWSVYLVKADGSQLQLDLWRGKILYNRADLYDITGASAGEP